MTTSLFSTVELDNQTRSEGHHQPLCSFVLLTLFVVFVSFLCFYQTQPPTKHAITTTTAATKRERETNHYVHIALPFDVGEYNLGMKALIGSIVNNTANPENLFFHFIVEPNKILAATHFVSELQLKLPLGSRSDFSVFKDWDRVKHLYSSESSSSSSSSRPTTDSGSVVTLSTATRFGNPLNVARIYLANLFPSVEKVISLDTDQILLGDIVELYSIDLSEYPIASTRSERAQPLSFYLNVDHPSLKKAVERGELDLTEKVFGGGLFVANLTTWRIENYIKNIENWCLVNLSEQQPLLAQKTLKKTLLNLAFNRRVTLLDDTWNSGDCNTPLFGDHGANTKMKILHFAGFNGKPWDTLSVCSPLIKQLWNFYFSLFSFSSPATL